MAQKLKAEIGVYCVIWQSTNGKILLVQRPPARTDSIIPSVSFAGCWELPGGAVEEVEQPVVQYDHLLKVVTEKVQQKVGIRIWPSPTKPLVSAFFKNSKTGGYDLACVIDDGIIDVEPIAGAITQWVSTAELNNLAREFESATDAQKHGETLGKGLLSGWGKRMHFMALSVMQHSGFTAQRELAIETLREIIQAWS